MKKEILIILAIIVLLPILFFLAPTIFALLLLAGIIMLKVRYPVIKGAIGEWYVNKALSKLGTNYKILPRSMCQMEKVEQLKWTM
ncbi:hypothetical protein [Bacillus weihaiensis]|uniref:hypothetical protein n=1 Tax=Bacillus weihaiensis TaxID=1547283 RepID=UPI002354AFDF|nr:hypothetical protein [Bacillus weihaiensis]